MKKDMEKIDELIKEALTEEEAAFYDELEEQGLLGKIWGAYRGKVGWMAIVMTIMHLVVFIGFLFCAIQFFNSELTKDLIKWASGGFMCLMALTMLKLYIWMQMDKNDVLRELKRVELQVAALSSKVNEQE